MQTLCCAAGDGMGWTALLTQSVNASIEIHRVTSAADTASIVDSEKKNKLEMRGKA